MHVAASEGHHDLVRQLIDAGYDINEVGAACRWFDVDFFFLTDHLCHLMLNADFGLKEEKCDMKMIFCIVLELQYGKYLENKKPDKIFGILSLKRNCCLYVLSSHVNWELVTVHCKVIHPTSLPLLSLCLESALIVWLCCALFSSKEVQS